ncbi:hypothetical protein HPP92_024106 [Vanilla planifolia]|uniref:Uncharacterized protein n=1 Tax=Vanilla planifolia TaxID=51239 RepID=A0A835PS55_VANPL|nr:hypothetical protein HPP92_024106 [Vanilla planifolia]
MRLNEFDGNEHEPVGCSFSTAPQHGRKYWHLMIFLCDRLLAVLGKNSKQREISRDDWVFEGIEALE